MPGWGRLLAFTAESASGTSHLWVRELGSRDPRRLRRAFAVLVSLVGLFLLLGNAVGD